MKLFCCSDLHSFYEPFKRALDEKGFEENNPEHLLVVCGDVFDRGLESAELYQYLDNLTNVILVRGNHEYLLEELFKRGYPASHDESNGTFRTAIDLADIVNFKSPPMGLFEYCLVVAQFLEPFLNKYVNYFETENYIFVHSWLPSTSDGQYREDWRAASGTEWIEACWGNPFDLATAGLNKTGKTIVFGHWHTSWPRHQYENKPEFLDGADFSPYYGENFIGLDACTAWSKTCNVIVLEDNLI